VRTFKHIDAHSVNETCEMLGEYQGRAKLNAGGTDLLSTLKGDIHPEYPEAIINIKTIPDHDYIRKEGNILKIGALTLLSGLIASPLIKKDYPILADAAQTIGSPHIRNTATIGGNLVQDSRCWYYRYPRHIGGPLLCLRKGSGPCLAVKGDNRYHAILGGKKCFSVCPSDMAVALAALDARVTITGIKGERNIPVTEFFNPLGNALEEDEMVKEIEVPKAESSNVQRFLKFTLRKPIDFAIVSVAVAATVKDAICTDARIILGAVAPMPYRARAAEEAMIGNALDEKIAAIAAEAALAEAKPLSMNAYKVQISKALVKRAISGGAKASYKLTKEKR
jgi:xanthine dehydrogenase YagS FAD-binding subunit